MALRFTVFFLPSARGVLPVVKIGTFPDLIVSTKTYPRPEGFTPPFVFLSSVEPLHLCFQLLEISCKRLVHPAHVSDLGALLNSRGIRLNGNHLDVFFFDSPTFWKTLRRSSFFRGSALQ